MIKDFEYFAPKTVEEALSLLSQYKEEAKIIAGGQCLLILMKERLVSPQYLIDIRGISALDYINHDENEGLRIGSLTPHRSIEFSPVIQKRFNSLTEMEQSLASVQTRNWGTIGGNICHGDPAGDPVPVLIALKATLKVASLRGERAMPVEDFTLDYFETTLEPDELLTEIQVPLPLPHTGVAYAKFNIIECDVATVGVAVSVALGSGKGKGLCEDVRIALGASAPTPMRAKKAEAVLRGKKITDDLLREAAGVASTEAEPISDIAASAEYRRELATVLVARVGKEA